MLVLQGLRGQGVFQRVLRSSGLTAMSYATTQALRLGSNLILTRLLFPEAFGLMALVSVFLVGLAMFSDLGIGPAIMQNEKGDEPVFLNSAWTIQIIRGLCLWILTCAIAWPAAQFFAEPMLAQLLPVAGLTLLIAGFNPTRIETAHRHLSILRVTILDVIAQSVGIACIVLFAWILQSVWALVLGAIVGSLAKLVLMDLFLEGPRNKLAWDQASAHELIHFGKWIFFSTACGFLLGQGDKAILGKYLTLQALGIYNIGFFLASFPLLLMDTIVAKVLIPLYRSAPPGASAENFQRVRKLRFGLTGLTLTTVLIFGFAGVWLVDLLYDSRYVAAGAIVVAISCGQVIAVVGRTYDQAALAAGDSRTFFFLIAARAILQTVGFLVGVNTFGLLGALIGQAVAFALIHPLIVVVARKHKVWDPLHDAVFFLLGIGLAAVALSLHWEEIIELTKAGFS